MFLHLTTLKHAKVCTHCGQRIHSGEEVVCEYTLLGRRFYHKPCYFDMAMMLSKISPHVCPFAI